MATEFKRMRQLVGTPADWAANDLVIGDGEIALERQIDGTATLRVGDGVKPYSALVPIGFGHATVVVGNGVTDNAAAILAANAAGKPIWFEGISTPASPVTITVPILNGPFDQILNVGAPVTIDNGMPVYPFWWGDVQGALKAAVDSLPATGGTVQLEMQTCKPNGYRYGFGGVGVGITKDNVKIQGRKMPQFNGDCTALVRGSIIQGQMTVYANNFEMRDVGVDSGLAVLNAYFGGVEQAGITEALGISYPDDATKAASALRRGIKLHNVIGLCSSPGAPAHAVLMEGVTDVVCSGDIVGCYGVHGVVFKCNNVKAESITAFCNGSDGLIIKSDVQTTAIAKDIQIGKVFVRGQGPEGLGPYAISTTGFGVLFLADGNNIDRVEIGQIIAQGYPTCVGNQFGAATVLRSISIGSIITDCAGIGGDRVGMRLIGGPGKFIRSFHVESLDASNASHGAEFNFNTPSPGLHTGVTFGHIHVTNAGVAAINIGQFSWVGVDIVTTDACGDSVYRFTGTPRLMVGQCHKDSNTPRFYSSLDGGIVPALAPNWTEVGSANDPFGVDLIDYGVRLRGLIHPNAGATNTFITLPVWARPTTQKRGHGLQGFNGAAVVAVDWAVSPAGVAAVNEIAGGTANCSSWLSLQGATWDSIA